MIYTVHVEDPELGEVDVDLFYILEHDARGIYSAAIISANYAGAGLPYPLTDEQREGWEEDIIAALGDAEDTPAEHEAELRREAIDD